MEIQNRNSVQYALEKRGSQLELIIVVLVEIGTSDIREGYICTAAQAECVQNELPCGVLLGGGIRLVVHDVQFIEPDLQEIDMAGDGQFIGEAKFAELRGHQIHRDLRGHRGGIVRQKIVLNPQVPIPAGTGKGERQGGHFRCGRSDTVTVVVWVGMRLV